MKLPYKVGIKNLFLTYPSMVLPKNSYVTYLGWVSTLYSSVSPSRKKQKFEKALNLSVGKETIEIWKFGAEGQAFFSPSAHRLSRFLKGFDAAAERQWVRYGIDKLIGRDRPDVIFDIGANIGEFSWAAHIQNYSEVHAFEPDPIALYCLEANAKDTAIKIRNLALDSKNGRTNFFSSPGDADSSFIEPLLPSEKIVVMGKTIESYINENKISGRILMKMDAEGAEPQVLRGLGETAKLFSWVSIDVGPENQGKDTINEVTEILMDLGFETKLFSSWILHATR